MKIRRGFVSNSSSSSFCIDDTDFTTIQVAEIMLWKIISEWINWKEDISDELIKAFEWIKNNQDYDNPVCFPWSVNECTYIWREGSCISVSTCNNHDWSSLNPNFEVSITRPKIKYFDLAWRRIVEPYRDY